MRKALEFQEGDNVILRVTLVTGIGQVLKSRKLTPRFIGLNLIIKQVRKADYRFALPPFLSNLHGVCHVSQLKKYILDSSHVIQGDDVQVRENFTIEAYPLRVEDREVNHLRGKEIALVKVVWEGPAGGSVTWELESRMRESYPTLFISSDV
ncbi:uncharacterized protein LOC127136271 [Lathyrus oleraceus]|uniref:uncharacterized protein LOC127136271 n=1 Tax=Pisum sativum TaxID=3888 RepID=UPI0021D07A0C|nr:uncharacterized protein LOC127136271 [Pisum sativum]